MSTPQLRFKDFSDPWQVSKLVELADVTTGNKDTQDKNDDGMFPFFVRSQTVERINTYSYDGEAILTSGDGVGVGKNFHYVNGKFDFHQRVYCIRNFKKQISGRYLFHYFSEKFNKRVMKLSAKNSVDSVRREMITDMPIYVPSISEQTKIANFLSSIDEKITQLTQKCDLLTKYKEGVLQQIFSQKLRFKDDKNQDFPEWEEHEIGEIFKVTRGNVLSMTLVTPAPSEHNPYPVFSSQTKNNGLAGYFNSFLYENSITWTTDGANAGDVNYRKGKFYCTNVCGVLINNKGYANVCVAELINAVSRKYVSYVGNPKLMNNIMAKIAIDFPCVAEQTKIARFLSAIDDKITNAQAQLVATKQYKQGLLQQMFV